MLQPIVGQLIMVLIFIEISNYFQKAYYAENQGVREWIEIIFLCEICYT